MVCYCSIGVRGSMVAQKLEHMFVKHGNISIVYTVFMVMDQITTELSKCK